MIQQLYSKAYEFHAQVRLKGKIGAGGFGSVYLGVYRDRVVAVKKLHRCVKNAFARAESFRAECNVVRLRHPNIVCVLAASAGPVIETHENLSHSQQQLVHGACSPATGDGDSLLNDAVIVMEYAGHRNLLTVIDDPYQPLDIRRRTRFSYILLACK